MNDTLSLSFENMIDVIDWDKLREGLAVIDGQTSTRRGFRCDLWSEE